MALPSVSPRSRLVGSASPRLAPPVPARSLIREYEAAAADLGIKLMPWQKLAGRYLTATVREKWLYREVCIVVARQNGKTSLLLPRILLGLRRGERMLHTAQNRAIPRETFLSIARALNGIEGVEEIRFANGQELIRYVTPDGKEGRYTLVAPRPGVRGYSVDTVFLDEVREQRSFDLIASVKPTLTASRNPQIVYLSNAGDIDSVVLNDLRRRWESDPILAYLEWSAREDRALDDHDGWAEANPALGVTIQLDTLEDFHRSLPRPTFETEHLCRWVISTRPHLVSESKWIQAHAELDPEPLRPFMAVSLAPSGTRASAAIAWQDQSGIGCRIIADVTGEPIDLDAFAADLHETALRIGITQTGYGSATDMELAKYFRKPKNITGREFANASMRFVHALEQGILHWDGDDVVGEDLAWTTRRPYESGAWEAVKAKDDREITAALAAIRAVWLASGPLLEAPGVY